MVARALTGIVPSQAKPFAGFVTDDDSEQAVLAAAQAAGIADPHVAHGDFDDVLKRLRKIATPRVLVVDLSGSADPIADIARLAEVCDEGTHVIAIGDLNDINLYRELTHIGVADYLCKPIAADVLAAALTNADRAGGQETQEVKNGQVLCFTGTRGGIGTTTVAVNVAWLIAHEHGKRVALVDLDLFFGTCGLSLDLDLGRGFREALENPARIDGLFIERAMVKSGDNLFVLCAEEALECAIHFDAAAVQLLIEHLRRDFQYVVVDLPRFALRTQASILTPPSVVNVISDPSLGGMRDTMRLLALIKKIVPKAEPSLILNKVGAHAATELLRADFEKGVESKVSHTLYYDAKAFGASASTGKPLPKIAAKARTTRVLRTMTQQLIAARAPKAPLPFWKKLMGAKA
jgi:pilus assembly protein CpaE